MQVRHTFQLFAVCPFETGRGNHDFYEVVVETDREIDVHVIEKRISTFGMMGISQEDLALCIAKELTALGPLKLEVHGKHSANSKTSVFINVVGESN